MYVCVCVTAAPSRLHANEDRACGCQAQVCVFAATERDLRNSAAFWSHGPFDKCEKQTRSEKVRRPCRYDGGLQMLWSLCQLSTPSPPARLVCGFKITLFNTKVSVSISLSNILPDLSRAAWHLGGKEVCETCWWPGIEIQIGVANPFVKDNVCTNSTLTVKTKFIHSFFTHLGLQCPLMAAQAYTQCVV